MERDIRSARCGFAKNLPLSLPCTENRKQRQYCGTQAALPLEIASCDKMEEKRMEFILVIALGLVLSAIGLGLAVINRKINGKNAKRLLGMNVISLFGMLAVATIVLVAGGLDASASGTEATAAASASDGLRFIAAALSTGLACIGAGIAVASTGSAAIGAISEDPRLLGRTIIFVGLAEGIAIYGMIITILILNR
jgi:V/A-type H+-transporting ATPase subunit K